MVEKVIKNWSFAIKTKRQRGMREKEGVKIEADFLYKHTKTTAGD